jgi:hypothetical protein
VNDLQGALGEDVLLQVIDQRALDLGHGLVHGHRADGVPRSGGARSRS